MSLLDIAVEGVDKTLDTIKDLARINDRAVKRGVRETAIAIQTRARQLITDQKAVDTGTLRRAIRIEYFNEGTMWDGSSVSVHAAVRADTDYAANVEYGSQFTKMPPSSALDKWAKRHGLPNGFVVARAIARRGSIPARPFLIPAWKEESPKLIDRIEAAMRAEFGT